MLNKLKKEAEEEFYNKFLSRYHAGTFKDFIGIRDRVAITEPRLILNFIDKVVNNSFKAGKEEAFSEVVGWTKEDGYLELGELQYLIKK